MSEEFCVLQCYSCETFQIHLFKEALKWVCQICRVQQSFKRHYGKGTSRNCRTQVMLLNQLQLSKSKNLYNFKNTLPGMIQTDESFNSPAHESKIQRPSFSKWAVYEEKNFPDLNSGTNESPVNLLKHVENRKRANEMTEVSCSQNKKICKEEIFEKSEEAIKTLPEDDSEKYFTKEDFNYALDFFNLENEPELNKYPDYLKISIEEYETQEQYSHDIFSPDLADMHDVFIL